MKVPMNLAQRLIACALAFCVFFPALASAQSREVYSVGGVRVDVTAADAAKARTTAIDNAQRIAFDRLARRLTLPEEAQRLALPQPDVNQLNRMVDGIDIEDERRSGTRYIARLGVNFDPNQTRELLRAAGFTVVETRASPILVVAQISGAAPATQDLWRQAWEQGGFSQELTPIAVAPAALLGAPDWAVAGSAAAAAGAATAVFATATIRGGSVVAQLTEVGPGLAPRDRGTVQAQMTVGVDGFAPAFQRLAEAANARLQADWKTRLAAGAGARTQIAATALYANRDEWARIKQALASVATISEIRVEAIALDGAQVSFAYVGEPEGMQAELRRYGVALETGPQGPVLRIAS